MSLCTLSSTAPTIITDKDLVALELTAYSNNTDFLTERLQQTSFTAYWHFDTHELHLFVDTRPQPDWPTYLGNGRFSCSDREVRAAYEEAATNVMERVRYYFPRITDRQVTIDFAVLGAPVGTWRGGRMVLEGEQ